MARKVPIRRTVGRPLKVLEPITDWAADVAQFIIDYMERNNRIASGRSIESVEVEVTKPNTVDINAADSVAFALQGRKAGGFPPVERIAEWIEDKRLKFVDISLNSLAFLIARKIARSGTNPPKLREQNIALVIESKGKKHLKEIGAVAAAELNELWLEAFRRNPNQEVKTK